MIERALKNLLVAGVEDLTANPARLKDLLVNTAGLSESEADEWVTFWSAPADSRRGAPGIHHGYPRTKGVAFPAIYILLTADNETGKHLGDVAGSIQTLGGEIGIGKDVRGSFYTQVYTMLVMAQHPDVCVVYYQILKSLLYAIDDALIVAGSLGTTISGGDMSPDKSWVPDGYFVRQLTLTIDTEFCLGVDDNLSRAWKIDGLHINKEGAPGQDVGPVRTLVTPYEEEPDDVD